MDNHSYNEITTKARPVHFPPITDEELEDQAIYELEQRGRALSSKKRGHKMKAGGGHENRN